MSKLTKKQKALVGKVDSLKLYALADALTMVKECATAKFDESIDVAVQLGIDAKKSDQVVRGAVVLPNGTGKTARVAVFAQGAKAVITTGNGRPGSTPWVWALNALQNSMMFKPRWPSAGPMGGEGLALPAGTCSLMKPTIFFAMLFSFRVQTLKMHST
jgi:hypothetical protein